jgi:hypothetical protein
VEGRHFAGRGRDDEGPPAGRCDRQRWLLRWLHGFGVNAFQRKAFVKRSDQRCRSYRPAGGALVRSLLIATKAGYSSS